MELIDQSFTVWGECPADPDAAMAWIEQAGRTCYKSPMGDSPEKFIAKITKPDPPHLSVLEHSNLVAVRKVRGSGYHDIFNITNQFNSRWVKIVYEQGDEDLIILGNLRAWMECLTTLNVRSVYKWIDNNGFKVVPVAEQAREMKRVTVQLITDRNVLAEITRHRDDVAFSVESQRYVDYEKSMRFIKPSWYDAAVEPARTAFYWACSNAEQDYRKLRSYGLAPQHARTALNGQTATTITMTAYLPEWDWIFKLRTGSGAYPQMQKIMQPLHQTFIDRGWA